MDTSSYVEEAFGGPTLRDYILILILFPFHPLRATFVMKFFRCNKLRYVIFVHLSNTYLTKKLHMFPSSNYLFNEDTHVYYWFSD